MKKKPKMSKEIFIKLYFSKTNKEIAEMYGVTKQTVIDWSKKYGVKKGKTFGKSKVDFL